MYTSGGRRKASFFFAVLWALGGLACSSDAPRTVTSLAKNSADSSLILAQPLEFPAEVSLPQDSTNNPDSLAQWVLAHLPLPVLEIHCADSIPDEPRIPAMLRLHERGKPVQQSWMGIERRGDFTLNDVKASYRMELHQDSTLSSERNLSLLGMRRDDDWNVHSLYAEPLRINSIVANQLWRDLGRTTIALRLVEVVLNGRYQGLYALGEYPEQKSLGITAEGALIKALAWEGGTLLRESPPHDTAKSMWAGFAWQYPQTPHWGDFARLVEMIAQAPDSLLFAELPTRLDISNAIDYFLYMNLIHLADNFGKNIFWMRATTDSRYIMIPWDWNSSFGNRFDRQLLPADYLLTNQLFDRLRTDCRPLGWASQIRLRWTELRKGMWSIAGLQQRMRQIYHELDRLGVWKREDATWPQSFRAENLEVTMQWIPYHIQQMDLFMETKLCPMH